MKIGRRGIDSKSSRSYNQRTTNSTAFSRCTVRSSVTLRKAPKQRRLTYSKTSYSRYSGLQ